MGDASKTKEADRALRHADPKSDRPPADIAKNRSGGTSAARAVSSVGFWGNSRGQKTGMAARDGSVLPQEDEDSGSEDMSNFMQEVRAEQQSEKACAVAIWIYSDDMNTVMTDDLPAQRDRLRIAEAMCGMAGMTAQEVVSVGVYYKRGFRMSDPSEARQLPFVKIVMASTEAAADMKQMAEKKSKDGGKVIEVEI